MTKLQRVEAEEMNGAAPEIDESIVTWENGVTVETLPDFSKRIVIPATMHLGGLVVVFRDPTHEDLEFFEGQMKRSESRMDAVKRLGVRLCVEWGDRHGTTVPQWEKLRAVVSVTLSKVLDEFFSD